MAFLNLFKRGRKEKKEQEKFRAKQKPAEERRVKLKLEKKAAKAKPGKPVEKRKLDRQEVVEPKKSVKESPTEKRPKADIKTAYKILRKPHITEKASKLAEKNDYVFKVAETANKIEVKKAIEEVYGVQVVKVRTVSIPRKRKRLGRTQGWKSGYKKAIVRLREGQSIEILPR